MSAEALRDRLLRLLEAMGEEPREPPVDALASREAALAYLLLDRDRLARLPRAREVLLACGAAHALQDVLSSNTSLTAARPSAKPLATRANVESLLNPFVESPEALALFVHLARLGGRRGDRKG